MRTRKRYLPELLDELEERVVLSHVYAVSHSNATAIGRASLQPINPTPVLGTRVSPILIGSATRGVQFRDSSMGRISDAIDREYNSFTTDYLQAQSAYLAGTKSDTQAIMTLQHLTIQRVNLLAAQLVQDLSRVPNSLQRATGARTTPLQSFLQRVIKGNGAGSTSLLQTLNNQSIPPYPGYSGPGVTLYTLTATNAIETARVATVNAAKFLISGTFVRSH